MSPSLFRIPQNVFYSLVCIPLQWALSEYSFRLLTTPRLRLTYTYAIAPASVTN